MLDKIIAAIMSRDNIRLNKDYAAQATADATQMYNAGWDVLPDGTVVQTSGSKIIAIKQGNSVISQEVDGYVNMGKFVGKVKKTMKTTELLTDRQKETTLAQAIITKYYTVPKM